MQALTGHMSTSDLLQKPNRTVVSLRTWFKSIFGAIDRWMRGQVVEALPPTEIRATESAQRNAVLVIDASPSMLKSDWEPSRLAAAQQAAEAFVKRLARDDPWASVAVVSYHKGAKVNCPLTPVTKPTTVVRAVHAISTSGSTNITAGLKAAHGMLKKRPGNNQVVLLTDGHHNTGPSPQHVAGQLRDLAVLETVGIGGAPRDVDAKLLKAISSSYPDGTKRYRWIGDSEKLVQHFQTLAGRITRS